MWVCLDKIAEIERKIHVMCETHESSEIPWIPAPFASSLAAAPSKNSPCWVKSQPAQGKRASAGLVGKRALRRFDSIYFVAWGLVCMVLDETKRFFTVRWGQAEPWIRHHNPQLSMSRIRQAICARLAASATRLKSRRNVSVPGCFAGGGRGGTNCCDADCDAIDVVELERDVIGASIVVDPVAVLSSCRDLQRIVGFRSQKSASRRV